MDNQSKLVIKGMVCDRCVMTVTNTLTELGHEPVKVVLGEAVVLNPPVGIDEATLEKRLNDLGLSLLQGKNTRITQAVKSLVAEVYSGEYDFPEGFRFSKLVREKWHPDYEAVSDAFIAEQKETIERYIIDFRINKVKEYLVYSSLTLGDIAFKLNFSSVAYLSAQFKQHTGLTPSYFKAIKKQKQELTLTAG